MERFNKWLGHFSSEYRNCFKLIESKTKAIVTSDGPTYAIVHPTLEECIANGITNGVADYLMKQSLNNPSFWVYAGLFSSGIKAYAPSLQEFLALTRVTISVPQKLYKQPFPTFVLIVPDGVTPLEGKESPPCAVIGRMTTFAEEYCTLTTMVLGEESHQGTYRSVHFKGDDTTIEDSFDDAIPIEEGMEDSEFVALTDFTRAFVNACLLLTNLGCKEKGYANPSLRESLLASLKKKKLPDIVRTKSKDALKTMPMIYEIEQKIKLYESAPHDPAITTTGVKTKPHWRRGHWANVACGVQRKDRRLAYRAPVLVNAAFFAGELSNTKVVYKNVDNATHNQQG